MDLKINLHTHEVYPEIISDNESGEWLARLIKRNGKVVQSFKGSVDKPKSGLVTDVIEFRKNVSIEAYKAFKKVIAKYEIGSKK